MIINATTDQIDTFLRVLGFRVIQADHPITGRQVCFIVRLGQVPEDGGVENVDFYWSRAQALSAAIRGEA